MSTRVYLPCTPRTLAAVVAAGGVGPAPLAAHAVTDAVREALAAGEEEEYAAATAAAQSSIGLLRHDELARRVVLAVDVPTIREVPDTADPTVVEVGEPVPWRRVAAVLVDSADAEDAVGAALEALRQGSPDAARQAERCLDHELGWWAAQEVDALLTDLGGTGAV